MANLRGTKVCELFIPGESTWDTHKVNNLLINCDANAILAITVPRFQIVWIGCTL